MPDYYSQANGERVFTGSITIPRVGAWVADISLALSATISGPVTLTIGTLTLTGAIVRAGTYGGSRAYRLVGGAGGWRKNIAARSYVRTDGVSSALVIGDAAIEVGETAVVATPEIVGTSYVRSEEHTSELQSH